MSTLRRWVIAYLTGLAILLVLNALQVVDRLHEQRQHAAEVSER